MVDEKTLHLVGIGVGHSIAPPMHNHIARSLNLPWTFSSVECPTIQDLLTLARKNTTQGLVVTMPYKNTILSHLDGIDELSSKIGACNNIYRDPSNPSILRGTNTDWLGIKGCLLEKSAKKIPIMNEAALIVGAGGASRAAVYALTTVFKASVIYVLNRDDGEVADLIRDLQRLSPTPNIIHVKAGENIRDLETPYYIVGTVPDLEPKTEEELGVKALLEEFLSRPDKGVLLDMCFKPRRTRMIQIAEQLGWFVVEGTHVIGYQIEEQWRLWTGKDVNDLDTKGAWEVLMDAAEKSPSINF